MRASYSAAVVAREPQPGAHRQVAPFAVAPNRHAIDTQRWHARRRIGSRGIDQQDAVLTQPFAGGNEMLGIGLDAAPADRPPAELGGAEAAAAGITGAFEGFLRRVAEEDRGIGRLGMALGIAEQAPDRLGAHLAEDVPQGHLDA